MSTGRTRLLARAILLIVLVGLATLLSSPGDGPSPDPQPSVDPAAVVPPPLRTDTVNQDAPDPAESERRIEWPVRITGRVTSVSGEPVPAGVLVHARYDRDAIVIVKTDDAGRFELPEIPSGEIALFVHGGGWVSPGLVQFSWDSSSPFVADVEAGEEKPRELLAEPAGSVVVTVLLPDGSPAVGAEHSLEFGKLIDGLMYPVIWDPAEGTIRIADLVPGHPYEIGASAPGHARRTIGMVLPASGHTEELTIELPPRREIVLHVLDADTGRPIEDARVDSSCRHAADTGEDGTVRFDALPPGPLWIRASHRDYYRLEEALRLPASAEGSFTLRMARGLTLSGRALLPDGRPARHGWVYFSDLEGRDGRSAEITENGKFELGGLPPGECRLQVEADEEGKDHWWEGETVATAGQTGVVVRLSPASQGYRMILVRVLSGNGEPVPGVDIYMERAGGEWTRATSWPVPDGGYETLVGDDRPEFALEVANARDANGLPLALGAVRVGPLSTDRSEVTVRMPAEMAISGVVRDAGGNGLPGVLLSALPVDPTTGEPRQPPHRTVRTGRDGSFRLGGLWNGNYAVKVVVPKGFTGPADPILISAGDSGRVIRLEKGKVAVRPTEGD